MEDESVLTEEDKLGGSDGDYNHDGIGQATKIIRGGSWYSQKTSARSFLRSETRAAGSGGYHSVGFRVVALNPSRESLELTLPAGATRLPANRRWRWLHNGIHPAEHWGSIERDTEFLWRG